ncbi:1-(5-phosphoribosyl)-5-((5-phosphoribosylamino)methylideneamino)imidazole-4-carboxamide isomerase [Sulfolobus sp. B1]|uniref:HisA/HisF-related TIM barrel protein n=1 Tax=Sulfolobus sp. B1 TaxID=2200888 RepID=UPI00117E03F2|nr:HisA/HisF-related TIM barrel protein [Sulfolobus sp. B1]TRM96100.1 1-(5-phosphoribosyl)-5-((5-phosphoribosylamino)methylideneamino)imidazole-4-carboxamide isomerase [Sulfolobus sp. B1]
MIKVLPSIDISEGKAVKRIRGVKGTGLILGDPVKIAYNIYEEGYDSIHVIDLDSAEGVGSNEEYIKDICKIGFKWIQVGGGIRSLDRAKKLISLGVSAIILSTLPFINFKEFKHILDEGTAKGVDHKVKTLVDKIKGIREYAGGVSSLSDIQFLGSIGFNYVIVGMAFYLNKLREGRLGEDI